MGFLDDIKKVFAPQDADYEEEDDFFEEEGEQESEPERQEKAQKKEPSPRIFQPDRKKVVSYAPTTQMQMVLCKPEVFDDVPPIADHLNGKKTVVLNLESANRENSRRIIDFLSGVAYANHGNIKKVANSTYVVTPNDVDLTGELLFDDFDSGNMYL